MKKAPAPSVDRYIAAQPEAVRAKLRRVRSAIRKAVPQADEVISYGMPTYKADGRTIVHFAAWRQHFALYAATEKVLEKFGDELASYAIEKGTIRFPLDRPVPAALIARIARFRAREVSPRKPRA